MNLKRPTLRLSPLKPEEDDNAEHAAHAHLHALEFEYDCDAPKCQLVVHAVLPADHPEAAGKQVVDGYVQAELFSTTQDGGFGLHLRLEDQVILELGRLEYIPKKEDAAQPTADPASAPAGSTGTGQRPTLRDRRSRRLTFHLRRRTTNRVNAQRAVAGPALAVVDVEGGGAPDTKDKDTKNVEDDQSGVRVVIRLVALGEGGESLPSINEQATYLHIVRLGAAPADDVDEDVRPWVVKVVKREAVVSSLLLGSRGHCRCSLIRCRLASILSTCMKYTDCLQHHLLPLHRLATRILRLLQTTIPLLNVCFVSLHLAKSSFCRAVTWLHAVIVP